MAVETFELRSQVQLLLSRSPDEPRIRRAVDCYGRYVERCSNVTQARIQPDGSLRAFYDRGLL